MADTTKETQGGRRRYSRRTAEERIAELEARITEIKTKAAAKENKNDPIAKDIPKVQRRLRKFAQLAIDNERMDLSNSTMAFVAQLERVRTKDLGMRGSNRRSGLGIGTPPPQETPKEG